MKNDRLNLKQHVDYACGKEAKSVNVIATIMPYAGEPRSSKRRLLAAYRTILTEAIYREVMPICITFAEDVECYQRRNVRNVRGIVRADSLAW